jgi:hypothetical protein
MSVVVDTPQRGRRGRDDWVIAAASSPICRQEGDLRKDPVLPTGIVRRPWSPFEGIIDGWEQE